MIVSSNVGEDRGWGLGTSEGTVVVLSNMDEDWGWELGTSDVNELWYRYVTYSKFEERASPSTDKISESDDEPSRNSARINKAIEIWSVNMLSCRQKDEEYVGEGWMVLHSLSSPDL